MTTAPQEPPRPPSPGPVRARDLIALGKPRVSALVVATCGGGLLLAPQRPSLSTALLTLAGTLLVVAGANALNMFIERDSDRRMQRTRDRPLPARRLAPWVAVAFGLTLAAASLPVLALGANLLTAALGLGAFVAYVFLYTPLKRHTPLAIFVGAVPGAAPPVMGWTAATGGLDQTAAALFALLFLWQVPHFLAIAIVRGEDYRSAGLKVARPPEGIRRSQIEGLFCLVALVPVTVGLHLQGVAGGAYLAVALIADAVFLAWGLYGLLAPVDGSWARRLFLISLAYLPIIFFALALDANRPR